MMCVPWPTVTRSEYVRRTHVLDVPLSRLSTISAGFVRETEGLVDNRRNDLREYAIATDIDAGTSFVRLVSGFVDVFSLWLRFGDPIVEIGSRP